MEKYYKKELTEKLGQEKADKLAKLLKNYDNYIRKFKKDVNFIVEELNVEVHTGLLFKNKGE